MENLLCVYFWEIIQKILNNYNVFSFNYKYAAYVLYVLYLCPVGNYAFEFLTNFMAKIFYLADYSVYFKLTS